MLLVGPGQAKAVLPGELGHLSWQRGAVGIRAAASCPPPPHHLPSPSRWSDMERSAGGRPKLAVQACMAGAHVLDHVHGQLWLVR